MHALMQAMHWNTDPNPNVIVISFREKYSIIKYQLTESSLKFHKDIRETTCSSDVCQDCTVAILDNQPTPRGEKNAFENWKSITITMR